MKYNQFSRVVRPSDDETQVFIQEKFGVFLTIGLIDVKFRTPAIIIQSLELILTVVFFILSAISTWLLRDDLILFSRSFQFTIIYAMILHIYFTLNFHSENIKKSFKFLASSDFVNYEDALIMDNAKKEVEKESEAGHRILVVPLLAAIVASSIIFCSPLIEQISEDEPKSMYLSGVNVNLPIPLYLPFESHEGVTYYLCCLFVILAALNCFTVVGTTIYIFLLSLKRILFELKLLHKSVELIHKRAENLNRKLKKNDFTYDDCLLIALHQNVTHYAIIKEDFQNFGATWGNISLVATATSVATLTLGMTAFSNLIQAGSLSSGTVPICNIIVTLCNTFIANSYGEKVMFESSNLFDTMYFTDWYNYSERFKRKFHIFKEFTKTPMTMYLGIWPLSVRTFTNVINSAYSYFNLLNALGNRKN